MINEGLSRRKEEEEERSKKRPSNLLSRRPSSAGEERSLSQFLRNEERRMGCVKAAYEGLPIGVEHRTPSLDRRNRGRSVAITYIRGKREVGRRKEEKV